MRADVIMPGDWRIFIGELAVSRIAVAVKNSLCGLELPSRDLWSKG